MADQESDNTTEIKRLVVVSNRLPIVFVKGDSDDWHIEPGAGGLITALAPILKNRGGLWIGWSGISTRINLEKLLQATNHDTGYSLKPVNLTEEEIDKYYFGFSNEIIWPLFHDLPSRCNFDATYWDVYQKVNLKFSQIIAQSTESDDYIWVQDYHLMLIAKDLRSLGIKRKIGFFLHTPFPQLDIFVKLPWRFQILRALLEYDLIGFQTLRDRRNFTQCLRFLIRDIRVQGTGSVATIKLGEREIRVGNFPISIDFNAIINQATSHEVSDGAWYIHEYYPQRKIILGVDRLDYTKGIPWRLKAFKRALERFPELQRKITLVQIVVPSREDIPEYNSLKHEIDCLVGEINGRFTQLNWVPIHYIFRNFEKNELLAYYRTAEVALVTPLKDGMNLVAKEYCTCKLEDDGVLILSEFAGAAAQLQTGALLVNPYDSEGIAEAIYHAITMKKEEQRARMIKLRRSIRKNNIFWWVNGFLHAAIAKNLDNFPPFEFYVPSECENHDDEFR
ncbi:MAG: alpha,alpha-trehalose-phosphate synthase (UDP-forming) [bacterium]